MLSADLVSRRKVLYYLCRALRPHHVATAGVRVVLRRAAGRREELLGHPAWPAGRELHARVARVAGSEHFPVTQDRVFEAEGGSAQLR
jgi:hypothetical protein